MKIFLSFALAFLLLFAAVLPAYAEEHSTDDMIVYISDDDPCYHLIDCEDLPEIHEAVTVAQAQELGYKECFACVHITLALTDIAGFDFMTKYNLTYKTMAYISLAVGLVLIGVVVLIIYILSKVVKRIKNYRRSLEPETYDPYEVPKNPPEFTPSPPKPEEYADSGLSFWYAPPAYIAPEVINHKKWRCPICGNTMKPDRTCPKCGANLKDASTR